MNNDLIKKIKNFFGIMNNSTNRLKKKKILKKKNRIIKKKKNRKISKKSHKPMTKIRKRKSRINKI